jgi:hypothetical protein
VPGDGREPAPAPGRRSPVTVVRALVAVLVVASGLVVAGGSPAYACSCHADMPIEKWLAESDAAFVGVYTGRDGPAAGRPVVNLNQEVVNHFEVERSVKGTFGKAVDVSASGSGASCGLELTAGDRTGLMLHRDDAGGWTSSLCGQVGAEELLAFAGASSSGPGSGPDWGFILFAGLLVLAVPVAFVVGGAGRRAR